MKNLVLTCLFLTVFTAGSALAADRAKDQDRIKDKILRGLDLMKLHSFLVSGLGIIWPLVYVLPILV